MLAICYVFPNSPSNNNNNTFLARLHYAFEWYILITTPNLEWNHASKRTCEGGKSVWTKWICLSEDKYSTGKKKANIIRENSSYTVSGRQLFMEVKTGTDKDLHNVPAESLVYQSLQWKCLLVAFRILSSWNVSHRLLNSRSLTSCNITPLINEGHSNSTENSQTPLQNSHGYHDTTTHKAGELAWWLHLVRNMVLSSCFDPSISTEVPNLQSRETQLVLGNIIRWPCYCVIYLTLPITYWVQTMRASWNCDITYTMVVPNLQIALGCKKIGNV